MQQQVLYESPDLLVRATRHEKSPGVVVTFSPMVHGVWEPGPGFGEEPLNKHEVSHVVFIAKWSHWWQCGGMPEALTAARAWIAQRDAQRVSAYGSSMGAYGALMFAGELQCTHALALGPQFSIDRAKVPFETRWKGEAGRLQFVRDDLNAALQSRAQKYVLYDAYHHGDRAHLALMHGRNLNKVPVPFAGHAIGKYMKETGQLKGLLMALINGSLDEGLPQLIVAARRERRNSLAYRDAVLDRLQEQPHHRRWLIALATASVKANPRERKFRQRLATALHESGRHAEAREHAEAACVLSRDALGTLILLRKIVVALGDRQCQRELTAKIVAKRQLLQASRPLAMH